MAAAVLGVAGYLRAGAGRRGRRASVREGADQPGRSGRRPGPDGDGDHLVHGRDLRRAPEPGRVAGLRAARGLPVEAGPGLHPHPADRRDAGLPVPALGVREHRAPWGDAARAGVQELTGPADGDRAHALLVSVILGTASAAQNVGAIAALGVGGYIALAGLWSAPVSGTSMNPARSFGPALVSG